MKNDIYKYLIFKLNSEHADYEFDLIAIPPYEIIENGLSLESYEYFGTITEILNQRTKHILLYFNADVLMKVEFLFKGDLINSLKEQLNNINVELPDYLMLALKNNKKYTILMYQNKVLNKQTT
ncbi:hypothetical protein ASG22_04065 [Chryseobacterium sp. Leaf405]|uniref:hypothetical protein n=1 Tax=Chryseobacterium sp. Leaf405 TaxID=1736367 RepID=UPI0006F41726|nr:hypothetical protein [Chryseobacterium sp. Leaf405]KQT25883.1 hypothetical protein ASG22_04065 [Chryseobacterium sp. Leaf405]